MVEKQTGKLNGSLNKYEDNELEVYQPPLLNMCRRCGERRVKTQGCKHCSICNAYLASRHVTKMNDPEKFRELWFDLSIQMSEIAKHFDIKINTLYVWRKKLNLPHRSEIK